MRRCRNVRASLPGHVAGLSHRAEHSRIETHLAECAGCRAARERLVSTLEDLRRPFPGEEGVDWDAFTRSTVERARARHEGREGRVGLDAPDPSGTSVTATGRREADVVPFGSTGFGLLVGSRWMRVGAAAAASLAVALGVYFGTARRTTPGASGREEPDSHTARREGGAAIEMPGSRRDDILRAVEAISARRQVAAVLTDARDLLWSLSSPVACNGEGVSLEQERRASQRILYRARLLEPRMSGSEAERARPVWTDVEQALVDLETLPDCAPSQDLEAVRRVALDAALMARIDVAIRELGDGRTVAGEGPIG